MVTQVTAHPRPSPNINPNPSPSHCGRAARNRRDVNNASHAPRSVKPLRSHSYPLSSPAHFLPLRPDQLLPLPFIYLPSYTTNMGYSATHGAYTLAAANFAQIFGEIGFGQLSDRLYVHCLVLASTLVSSIAVLALWGHAHTYVRLAWFALIYSTFGSGLISLWARVGTLFGEDDAQMIYSIMSFGCGIGTILSGPISSALIANTASRGLAEKGDGPNTRYGNGKYLGLVLFVGCTMGFSAFLAIIGLLVGWRQNDLGRVN
jgi:MFS family permease